MRRLIPFVVLALAAPGVAAAQTSIPPAFLGTWQSLGLDPGPSPLGAPPTELPWSALDKKIGDYMQPWALAKQQALEWNTDDTGQACKPTGPFRQGHAGAGAFRFVEAGPGRLYQVGNAIDQRGVQRILFDVAKPPTLRPTWNGESRGRFEGADTLVIDTVGYNDKSWLNSDRWPHTEELRVIERYRLYGGGAYMQVRVFVDDRLALKEPYTYTRYYRKAAEPTQGGESVCNQNLPEEDIWAERRNKLLNEFDARLDALVAKFAAETLPSGTDDRAAAATADLGATRPAADPRLRALAGVYEPVTPGDALPAGRAAVSGPADLALLPAAVQMAKSRDPKWDPAKHCMVVGPFRMMARPDARFEVLPTASRVTLLFENVALGNKREVYLGRAAHATSLQPSYHGDSIARWEDDALVVETTGFNEFIWLNDSGAPHSDVMRLVERFRLLPGTDVLEYQVTADDPKTLARPASYTRYFRRSRTDLQESFCESR
jgi:hypothetical protein